ncbi:MAG TPA: fibrobacter succinogenes major paralogous domain-containing protein [Bacteroidales bacterium]|nr:fibrobacter succinogenes major paralogous domain-containing protein [Bacteroidales bacterium]
MKKQKTFQHFFLAFSVIVFLITCKKEDDSNVIIDGDGNVYSSVKIGNQEWLTENLKTTRYNDGTPIPVLKQNEDWYNVNGPACCWYNNDSVGNEVYGLLYNLYAVSSPKLCPKGWHIPTENEWKELFTYLGGEKIASNKLKEPGNAHWLSVSSDVTNETGFTALPGGYRGYEGNFGSLRFFGYWWAAPFGTSDHSSTVCMSYDCGEIYWGAHIGEIGLSVRCVKN